ncbi:MAG: hypothetical protein KDK39_04715 [Leptospiraceae bacterium]|nr:hypothetical protein [Leptospiraceae bacterium]
MQSDATSWIELYPLAQANLRRRSELQAIVGAKAWRWAGWLTRLARSYGMLSAVYANEHNHWPLATAEAPLYAFAHKKFHDVPAITIYMLARPLTHFHHVTIIGQAGIHSAVYPYTEWIPGFLKAPLLDPFAVQAARILSWPIKDLFNSVNTYAVYREQDMPATVAQYESIHFGGQRILGMDYEAYRQMARQKTRSSLVRVMQDISELNRSLVIAPEGGYCFDGTIQKMQDFLAFTALKKNRRTLPCTISYDELCPDTMGRIDCYVHTGAPLDPPAGKTDTQRWSQDLQRILTQNTTIVASQLIAAVLWKHRAQGRIGVDELGAQFHQLAQRMSAISHLQLAPGLLTSKTRERSLRRFLRSVGRKWLRRRGSTYIYNQDKMDSFTAKERTVGNLEWNYNHIAWLVADW